MKMVSWNVNGLRACLQKGFMDFFTEINCDIFAVQETKMQPHQAEIVLEGYTQYWNSAEKKGYSGTAVFSRLTPLSVQYGIGKEEHATEGRSITLEFEDFFFVTVYTPNAQDKLARLDYRLCWEDDFRSYLLTLKSKKSVIVCGDLNVAHQEIDLKNPKTNHNNPGFSDAERAKMTTLLESGFVDSFRTLYPNTTDAYSWWSYRFHAREKNMGWRIDYFLLSEELRPTLVDATIRTDILGSDHCPVVLHLTNPSEWAKS